MPAAYPPGFAEGCKSKQILDSTLTKPALVKFLKEWMGQCASRGRENELVDNNQSVEIVLNELLTRRPQFTMNPTNRVKVYAHYKFRRYPNGQYGIKNVFFSMWPEPPRMVNMEEYSAAVAVTHRAYFEDRIYNFGEDLAAGNKLLEKIADLAHDMAKEVASLPKNPFGPQDTSFKGMVSELVGFDLTKPFDEALKDKVYDKIKEKTGGKFFAANSKEDVFTELVKKGFDETVDLAKKALGPEAKMFGLIPGMFADWLSASMAGEVATKRFDLYFYFAMGMGTEIAQGTGFKKQDGLQRLFFLTGQTQVKMMGSLARYQLGLALVDQYRLSPKYMHADPQTFSFPDHYKRFWGDLIMHDGFKHWLKKKKYILN